MTHKVGLSVKTSNDNRGFLVAKKKEPEKDKGGRPTKYRPEFCQKLIEHMRKGFSFESFGAEVGCAHDRVYEWAKVHAEFAEAKKEALALNLKFWESQGVEGMWQEEGGRKFNPTVWIFNMKNRHRWRDNQDIKIEHKDTTNKPRVVLNIPDNGRSNPEEKK